MATVVSMLLARSLKLPEFYWVPISTVVILLSTINPMTLAWQRFAGTGLGAAMGALIATFFGPSWAVYGGGIFICGILCSVLRLGTAYRFAAITFTIVLLGCAPASAVDCRHPQVCRGVVGNCGGSGGDLGVAGGGPRGGLVRSKASDRKCLTQTVISGRASALLEPYSVHIRLRVVLLCSTPQTPRVDNSLQISQLRQVTVLLVTTHGGTYVIFFFRTRGLGW